jgi:two-component system nitrate/nitrite response regulator NarL
MSAQTLEFAARNQSQADIVFSGSGPQIATSLICDNALLRSGLQHILSGTRFVLAQGEQASGSRVLHSPVQTPALLILALGQDLVRVCEVVKQTKELFPECRIVALADHFDLNFMLLGREAGIHGFCLTSAGREVLLKSLDLVMLGESVLPSQLLSSLLSKVSSSVDGKSQAQAVMVRSRPSSLGTHKLSARETEILGCLMDGAPNKVIARRLDVAEATIKVHVKAILRKIGAANRTQAAMWATENMSAKSETSAHA